MICEDRVGKSLWQWKNYLMSLKEMLSWRFVGCLVGWFIFCTCSMPNLVEQSMSKNSCAFQHSQSDPCDFFVNDFLTNAAGQKCSSGYVSFSKAMRKSNLLVEIIFRETHTPLAPRPLHFTSLHWLVWLYPHHLMRIHTRSHTHTCPSCQNHRHKGPPTSFAALRPPYTCANQTENSQKTVQ